MGSPSSRKRVGLSDHTGLPSKQKGRRSKPSSKFSINKRQRPWTSVNTHDKNLKDPKLIDDEQLCRMCKRIDWRGWIFCGPMVSAVNQVARLRHVDPLSTCRLCRFFAALAPGVDFQEVITPAPTCVRLRQSDARSTFGDVPESFPGIAYSPSFHISTPWIAELTSTTFLPDSSSVLPSAISGRELRKDGLDVSLVATWLRYCDLHHRGSSCAFKGPARVVPGLKVIHCPSQRLVPYRRNLGHYVTLSYVWGAGGSDDSSLAAANDPTRLPDSLPKLISDAIRLTLGLGCSYLWVDRYCIPQDNNDPEKLEQIRSMGLIYAQSSFTIIAAAGNGPKHGLPGLDGTRRAEQLSIRIAQGKHTTTLLKCGDIQRDVSDSVWNSRGWTYQEAVLSRRRLVITDSQAYFQCQSMHCRESVVIPLESCKITSTSIFCRPIFPVKGQKESPLQIYNRINEFLTRDLSFDADVINAMKGIFSLYRNARPLPMLFVCGLPVFGPEPRDSTPIRGRRIVAHPRPSAKQRLLHSLFWCASGPLKRRPPFPSWTWAGWKPYRGPKDPLVPAWKTDASYITWLWFAESNFPKSFHQKGISQQNFPIALSFEHCNGQVYHVGSTCDDVAGNHNDTETTKVLTHLDNNDLIGDNLLYLRIQGWCWKVTLEIRKKVGPNSYWRLTEESGFPGHQYGQATWPHIEDLGEQETLTAVAITAWKRPTWGGSWRQTIEFLLLRPRGGGFEPSLIFERVGTMACQVRRSDKDQDWVIPLPDHEMRRGNWVQLGTAQLEWKEVCIA